MLISLVSILSLLTKSVSGNSPFIVSTCITRKTGSKALTLVGKCFLLNLRLLCGENCLGKSHRSTGIHRDTEKYQDPTESLTTQTTPANRTGAQASRLQR